MRFYSIIRHIPCVPVLISLFALSPCATVHGQTVFDFTATNGGLNSGPALVLTTSSDELVYLGNTNFNGSNFAGVENFYSTNETLTGSFAYDTSVDL